MSRLTCAEPFAGAGGLAIGLVQAGFKCVYATDKDREAVGTLSQSVDAADCIMHSAETIAPFARAVLSRTAKLDLLAGGVPCQPFSQPGLNLGHLDPRDCFPHFAKMVELIEPHAFMIENVASLANSKHGPYLETVLAKMRERYTIDHRVLCAADYGAPQSRRRIIIVGFRDPAAAARFRWPALSHGEAELGHAKWKTGEYWDEQRLKRPDPSKAYKTSELQAAFQFNQARKVGPTGAPVKAGGGAQGFGLSFITNADRPSPTVAVRRPYAAPFLGDPGVVIAPTPDELGAPTAGRQRWTTLRDVLTQDELVAMRGKWIPVPVMARLQGFPPGLRFVGKTPDIVRQIGNAVIPLQAKVMGLAIAQALYPDAATIQEKEDRRSDVLPAPASG